MNKNFANYFLEKCMLTGPETALMNQFRCSKKMLLISIAFFIPLIITLSLLAGEQLRTIKFSQNEPLGVESIVPVRLLVQHIPEHRGMTNAYLSSNENFRVKTLETKKQIANEIPLIDRVDPNQNQYRLMSQQRTYLTSTHSCLLKHWR
jgi:hypothetical protein